MIQSDALSRQPDHCPEEDNDNEDMILLPENLFINLIDIDLQRRIAEVNSMDKDAETALLLLVMVRARSHSFRRTIKGQLRWSLQ